MKVLVTGGAGYIGSHITDLLIDRGHEAVVFDNLVTGQREAVQTTAVFVQGDLRNPADVAALFDQYTFDGVIHLASYSLVGESMQKPWMYLRDNVMAASNLLEQVTGHGVKRFILSSTANLFNDPTRIPIDASEPIIPGSPYGESKFIIERYLHWMDQIYGLAYCALRYFNASGAHPKGHIGEDHKPESHLIPLILQVALGQRSHIEIYGTDYETPDGTCIRDYIHVIDLAEAHLLALEALADGRSRRYNLGNGKGFSVQETIEVARRVTGKTITAKEGARRPGDLATLVADSSEIIRELGWQPEFNSLEQIVYTAWTWHQAHPHGYSGG